MDDVMPTLPTLLEPPRRDRRIVITAVVSAALHLALLGWILFPRTQSLTPTEPAAVNVDLVRPSALVSVEPPSSPSSAEASSSAAPSSAEPASSAEAAASAEASSQASASAPPVPQSRPILIPVGPSEPSSEPTSSAEATSASASEESAASEIASSAEASSAASAADTSSVLTATTPEASDGVGPTASSAAEADAPADNTPKPPAGTLHAAKRYYLDDMLNAPQMTKVRDALKTLPRDKRLAQTCNIEAIGQLGNAGRNYVPDALVASAFAKPVIAGTTYSVSNGAFRSKGKWIGIAYECTLSKDLDGVASFTYRLGGDVTAPMRPKVNGSQKP